MSPSLMLLYVLQDKDAKISFLQKAIDTLSKHIFIFIATIKVSCLVFGYVAL